MKLCFPSLWPLLDGLSSVHHGTRPSAERRLTPVTGPLIFDSKNYLYIGDSQIALNSKYMPKGTVNGNAVQRIAVTGKPGQLP